MPVLYKKIPFRKKRTGKNSGGNTMKRLGILFGGRSGEHEVSLMSATSVIKAMDKSLFKIVTIVISKSVEWLRYDGPIENIENGEWEKQARHFEVGSLKQEVDVVLPILHGPYGEDGTIPVSYTHLRAHETRHDLVCRLLLEKKKNIELPES